MWCQDVVLYLGGMGCQDVVLASTLGGMGCIETRLQEAMLTTLATLRCIWQRTDSHAVEAMAAKEKCCDAFTLHTILLLAGYAAMADSVSGSTALDILGPGA